MHRAARSRVHNGLSMRTRVAGMRFSRVVDVCDTDVVDDVLAGFAHDGWALAFVDPSCYVGFHRPSTFQKKMEGSQPNVFTATLERSDAVVGAAAVMEAFAEGPPSSPPALERKKQHGAKRPLQPPPYVFDDEEEEPSGESLGSADSEEEVDLFKYLSRFPLSTEEKVRILRKTASALAASCFKQIKKTRATARSSRQQ